MMMFFRKYKENKLEQLVGAAGREGGGPDLRDAILPHTQLDQNFGVSN